MEDSPEEYVEITKKNDSSRPKIVFVDDDIIECGKKIYYDCTHNNLANLYADYSKGEIFYTSGYGWIIYNKESKIWSYDNDKVSLIFPISSFFCHIMKEYCDYYVKNKNVGEMTKKEEEEFLKSLNKLFKIKTNVGNSGFIKGVIEQIQSLLTKDNTFLDNFDNKPNLFAFSDGKCIDLLKNGEVREIGKEDFIITTCGYPYPQRDETFIAKWKTIINSLSDNTEQLKSIKSLMSLSLWGENTNEVFLRLTGSGGNGKGLLDTGMKKTYGKYYQSINASQLTEYEKDNQRANSELASCRFARLVMATEPPDSNSNGKATTLKVPTLKKWTGRDVIRTRFLNKNSFEYNAKFILMLQENTLIDLSVSDEAIQRRMKVVELPFKFVVNDGRTLGENEFFRDETLKDTISQDEYRDALFYILLDTWLENNGRFYESQKVKEITNEFFETQNPVKQWFEQFYENDIDNKITSTEMFNSFKNDNYDSILTQTSFGKLLKDCCKMKKTKSANCYLCKKKTVEHPLYL
jgi:P4 family phage/plasmid primase-like protien